LSTVGRGFVLGCLTLLLAAAASLPAHGSPQDDAHAKGSTLADGEGKELVVEKCSTCHDLDRIPARRRDRYGWEDVVDSMRSRGAEISDEERTKIVDYLNAHYGIPD
jgi:hypothetical protein